MTKKIFYIGLMITVMTITACTKSEREKGTGLEQSLVQVSLPQVRLQAQNGATIEFQTQNGITHQGSDPKIFSIPHLTLYQNQDLTEPIRRTLLFTVAGVQWPPSGATISLLVETQNGEPISAEAGWERIPVWQENRQISTHNEADQTASPVTFTVVFSATILRAGEQIRTPTDYYRYQIKVTDRNGLILYTFDQEYAFLLENQWITQLPDVPEESPGAAPDELVIYYCDMTPFQKDIRDSNTWVEREAVNAYVGTELLPKMATAFHLQSQDWRFPWYQAWTSARKGVDADRLSVALTNGKTWYHGQAFPRGSSLISINVSGGENYSYDTLTDGILSTFHHELFHNQQRNINQYLGGQGWIGGQNNQWQFFTEGMAVLASSVAQPDIQFAVNGAERAYFANANLFLGSNTIRGDIGRDFSEISPYHAAIYWRFLYEQCGGMNAGHEDPAAGMWIIRNALVSLYQIAEGQASLEDWLPLILDRALTGSTCPFQTYTQSLTAFAQALDALRFEAGHCLSPGLPKGCGLYDPYDLYSAPPINTITLMVGSP